jgi:ribosomal protein L37AE/L43A
MRTVIREGGVTNSVSNESWRGGARHGERDDARGMVVVVNDYGVRGDYCCPSCDRSTLVQSADQTVDFVCANCDERVRERGGKYD